MHAHIIGAGLAGSEAAYQLASRGVRVTLHEMRPKQQTPAHETDLFAELVCSNSLRSNQLHNAVGVMKEEMRLLDSLIMHAADASRIPAGGALAVDRIRFAQTVSETLESHPNITVRREVVEELPDAPVIVASGPLTEGPLAEAIQRHTNDERLYLYDAVAPIITKDSVDFDVCYRKNRYESGEGDYINCPMDEAAYERFYEILVNAETVSHRDFEKNVFEGCMPIEAMARRGKDTLRYGPLKPVGLEREGEKRPYAVVQLRKDDARDTLYNLVGFQTSLTYGEQRRLIRSIPGLEAAEILRYGVMHKNTFLNAPKHLRATYQSRHDSSVFFAGQITGVEGYVESAASGIVAALNLLAHLQGESEVRFPLETLIGAQADYLESASPERFQPMNANFGLLPALEKKLPKRRRKEAYAERALSTMKAFRSEIDARLG